ncbi:unnamed protein product [Heterosigma akashiwo]
MAAEVLTQQTVEVANPKTAITMTEDQRETARQRILGLGNGKFTITVTDHKFPLIDRSHTVKPEKVHKEGRMHKDGRAHKTFTRTREYDTLKECVDCIKNDVKCCGERYIITTQFGQSEFETALVEVHRGGDLVCSSETIDFWQTDLEMIVDQLLV